MTKWEAWVVEMWFGGWCKPLWLVMITFWPLGCATIDPLCLPKASSTLWLLLGIWNLGGLIGLLGVAWDFLLHMGDVFSGGMPLFNYFYLISVKPSSYLFRCWFRKKRAKLCLFPMLLPSMLIVGNLVGRLTPKIRHLWRRCSILPQSWQWIGNCS